MQKRSSASAISTSKLLSGIFKTPELVTYMEGNKQQMRLPALPDYLMQLCEERGLKRAAVIQASGVERSFGFQIFSGKRGASRDKLLQLAVGFGLDYEETQQLLRIGRKSALYPRIKRDAAIIYCLSRRLDIADTQTMLARLDLSALGKESER